MDVRQLIEQIKTIKTFRELINGDGHVFERVFDLIVRTNEHFDGFKPVYGNFGTKKEICVKELSFQEFLNQKINNGSAQGEIDLVLKNDTTKQLKAFTFKYFKEERAKDIKKYDVKELFETGRILQAFYSDFTITYGIVTNCHKDDLLDKINRSKHTSNCKLIENYTLNDIEVFWSDLYTQIKDTHITELIEKIDGKKLSGLTLRYYQKYAVKKIQKILEKNDMALLGALPRFGKTYVAGELLLDYHNVLFTSNIVTNLKEGLTDFFTEHSLTAYKDYRISIFDNLLLNPHIKDKKIVITSNQKLTITKSSEKFDLIIFDEAHIGGTSENVKESIKKFQKENTKLLYCTATFKKPYREFDMENKSFIMSIDDIVAINAGSTEDIETTLGRSILSSERTIKYPKINYINLSLKPGFKTELIELMEVNKSQNTEDFISMWKNNFTIKNNRFLPEGKLCITNVLDTVFKLKSKRTDNGLIKKISNNILNYRPKIILCFCPGGSENMTSEKVLKNIQKLFDERYCSNMYKSLIFYSGCSRDIKSTIESNVSNDKTLVVFVCRMLETAITLKECSGVIFLDDNHSEDVIIQRIFRPSTHVDGKDNVFVLDINPLRTIEFLIRIGIRTGKIKSIDDIKRSIQSIDSLIHFDSRDFGFDDNDAFYSKIIDLYFEKAHFIGTLQEIDYDYSKLKFSEYPRMSSKTERIKEIENKSIIIEASSKYEATIPTNTEELERKKKIFNEMIAKAFYMLSIISETESIEDALNEQNVEETITNICNNHYKSNVSFEEFKYIIRAYNQEFLNQSFLKTRNTFMSGNLQKKFEIINKLLKPNELQKKANGEVFTPLKLVNEMLDKLPNEVWTNPNLKWLDPAVGVGNFPIVVYQRLMESLTMIPILERSEHILKKMLYAADICPVNVQIYTTLLGKTNVFCGSYFDFDLSEFDVIVGNPPYNDGSGNKGKSHTLWTKFIEHSLQILKEDGYLCFVNPSLWRQIEHSLFKLMTKNQLLYLEIHGVADGQKTFRCSTRYDWYVLHKNPPYTTTTIKDEDGMVQDIDISKWKFLPNKMYKEISEITATSEEYLDVNYYRSNYGSDKKCITNKIQIADFKYPVIYTINKANVPTLMYSNRNDRGHFGLSKFIFSNGAGTLSDPTGKYGITQWSYCIYDTPENLDSIQKAFQNPKFKKIIEAIHFSSATYNIKVMKLFKKEFYKEFL